MMSNEHADAFPRPTLLGRPQRCTVAAVAVAREDARATLLAGTTVGLFRSVDYDGARVRRWQRMPSAPIGILSVAASPRYASDHLILVGTGSGISYSNDGGATWSPARMPLADSIVTTIRFSPDFHRDGVALAGTMHDGVLYSDDRGVTWQSRSIGLLDHTILSVCFSPQFGADRTVFAGGETALYLSYNGARAWKQTDFPEASAPASSLAVVVRSPDRAVLLAGTERDGLHRSLDQGDAWERLSLPGGAVNALDVTDSHTVLAATDAGVFQSTDDGASWSCLLDMPHALSLAAGEAGLVAGFADEGLWTAGRDGVWQRDDSLAAHAALGVTLSPEFAVDRRAYMFAPQERLWKTDDGGREWNELNGDDDPAAVWHVVAPTGSALVFAASDDGVLVSRDGGSSWVVSLPAPAAFLASSPDGAAVAVRLQAGAVCVTRDGGASWQDVAGPWDDGGVLAALAITGAGHFVAAMYDDAAGRMVLHRGPSGAVQPLVSRLYRSARPAAAIFAPPAHDGDSRWYAAFGNQVWMVDAQSGAPPVGTFVFTDGQPGEAIVSLVGARQSDGDALYACTGRRLFASLAGGAWRLAHDFGDDPAVAVALQPRADGDAPGRLYALLIGGRWCEIQPA